jgi:hypothetical protein
VPTQPAWRGFFVQERDELAPLHSITSSARARRIQDIELARVSQELFGGLQRAKVLHKLRPCSPCGGERKKRPRRGRGQLPPFRVFELCGRLPLSFRLPKQFRTAGNRSPSPITITARRAEGSGVACEFHSTQRESSNVWRLRAECASQTERWNANIRLTVSTSKLTWSSERGVTTYVRCPTTSASL